MQTLTRIEPCQCALGGGDCTHVTVCRMRAAVEDEAEEWSRKVAALEAENARLREIICKCTRIPVMPFPDPEAHSWRAFGEAAYSAWSRIRVLLSEAEAKL